MRTQKNKTRDYLIAAVMLTSSTTVSAQDMSYYFGVGLNQSNLVTNQLNMAHAYSTSTESTFEPTGFGLGLTAGINVDEHLAFEITYSDLGSIALNNGSIKEKAFNVDLLNINAKISHPINENFSAFGKLGISLWDTYDDDLNTLESGNGFLYGAGVDINLYGNHDRILRVEWLHNEFENIIFESADTISISAIFNF